MKLILSSKYAWLLFHDHMNYAIKDVALPEIKIVEQNSVHMRIQISGEYYVLPVDFPIAALKGLYKEIFSPFKKNPHAYETKLVSINPSEWVIDAGACEGFFIRYALQRHAKVLAIEPVPELAESLNQTFEKEISEGRVKVINAGLGRVSGSSIVNTNREEIYCSTVTSSSMGNIPIVTVDELIRNRIIPSVHFIKMDIEGAEKDAIYGAMDTIRQLSPKLSIAVYHNYENADHINQIVKSLNSEYRVSYRGIFIRAGFGLPRPFMLHAVK